MEKRRITKFIKNEVGTDRDPIVGDSWIRYWLWNSNQYLSKCPRCGSILKLTESSMFKIAEGAHIRLLEEDNSLSKKVYIVPMCHECNCQFGGMLQVKNGCEDIIVVEEIYKE